MKQHFILRDDSSQSQRLCLLLLLLLLLLAEDEASSFPPPLFWPPQQLHSLRSTSRWQSLHLSLTANQGAQSQGWAGHRKKERESHRAEIKVDSEQRRTRLSTESKSVKWGSNRSGSRERSSSF